MTSQQALFYELLEEHIHTLKCGQDKFCVSKAQYAKIAHALCLERGRKCEDGSKFKAWCRSSFQLRQVGATTSVCCAKTSRPVVTKEDMFHAIKTCHQQVGHSGRDRTWQAVKTSYAGVKYPAIDLFLKTCPTCQQKQLAKNPPGTPPSPPQCRVALEAATRSIKPVTPEFLLRLEVDLIDCRRRPDGDFKWILHARDQFTKFSWCYALRTRGAEEVAEKLLSQFCTFGPPRIMRSDQGREFTADVIRNLASLWPGLYVIRGRHPEPQDGAARGYDDLQVRLGKWMEENGSQWSRGLLLTTHAINTAVPATAGNSPHQLVFGQTPRSQSSLWEELARLGAADEDDIPAGVLHQADGSELEEPQRFDRDNPQAASGEEDSSGAAATEQRGDQPDVAMMENPAALRGSSDARTEQQFNEVSVKLEPEDEDEPLQYQAVTAVLQTQLSDESDGREIPAGSGQDSEIPSEESAQGSSLRGLKRGKDVLLLSDSHVIAASGYEVKNWRVFHGEPVDTETHAVIAIDEVFDAGYDQHEGDPDGEPLQSGHVVLWRRTGLVKRD